MNTELRVEHIAINVESPDAMAAWYCEHLGMKVARRGDATVGMQFLSDASGRVVLEIYRNPPESVPRYAEMNPLILHVAFATEDVVGSREKLITAGATAQGDVETTASGDRLAMLRDPWGLALQLCQRAIPME